MTWVKIDDKFADHPKFAGLSDAALGLWLRALAYASRRLTDGRVPATAVRALTGSRKPEVIAGELVTAGLWESGTDGYVIRDYLPIAMGRRARGAAGGKVVL